MPVVEVYRNLHFKNEARWSVRMAKRRGQPCAGLVIRHPRAVLLWSATFVVRPAGRRKVLETGRKNVHAFVRGVDHLNPQSTVEGCLRRVEQGHCIEVTYNPRKYETFVNKATGEAVHSAGCVWLIDGRVFAMGVNGASE